MCNTLRKNRWVLPPFEYADQDAQNADLHDNALTLAEDEYMELHVHAV